jgi:hypothetical protein
MLHPQSILLTYLHNPNEALLMVTRTLRRLQGITYWVINDREEIRRFVNSNVKQEWERDNQKDGIDSRKDDWLLSLPKREWRARVLGTSKVRLDPSTMSREAFTTRLRQIARLIGSWKSSVLKEAYGARPPESVAQAIGEASRRISEYGV